MWSKKTVERSGLPSPGFAVFQYERGRRDSSYRRAHTGSRPYRHPQFPSTPIEWRLDPDKRLSRHQFDAEAIGQFEGTEGFGRRLGLGCERRWRGCIGTIFGAILCRWLLCRIGVNRDVGHREAEQNGDSNPRVGTAARSDGRRRRAASGVFPRGAWERVGGAWLVFHGLADFPGSGIRSQSAAERRNAARMFHVKHCERRSGRSGVVRHVYYCFCTVPFSKKSRGVLEQ